MTPPKVVHLVYDLIRGGTEGQCARVALGLTERGWPQRVAVFHRRGFFLPAVEAACGPVREVEIRHLFRFSTVWKTMELARWLRAEKADILHAWDADAAVFGQYAAAWAGVRFATSRRDMGEIYAPRKAALMRRADRKAVAVAVNAEAIRARFAQLGVPPGKMTVLPNILDVAERDRLAKIPFSRAAELPEGRRLAVVNRLDTEKRTELLIQALPLVRRRAPDAVLVVAGDGREMPRLREMAAALGVDGAVCFLGDTPEIPALLPLCMGGALVPSGNEGLSNTILEYMAAGLPVLATDCGGNRELVEDGRNGWLLPREATPAQVAEGWVDWLTHPETARKQGALGREKVQERFSPGRALDAFEAFYQSIL